MQFSDLGLAAPILRTLEGEGYATPTPIQSQAIPHILAGHDLLGLAATGTGKTAAFALPILHNFAASPRRMGPGRVRALVLSPTRELSAQIAASVRVYGRGLGLASAVIVGGAAFGPQTKALARGLDVLVATPGRLLDHIGRRTANLDAVEVLVLDEADHMLDLGFIPAIRQLIAYMPRVRQNLFFSATMPKEIDGLAAEILRAPRRVSVVPSATPAERIAQSVVHVEPRGKPGLLADMLRQQGDARALVFTRTKRGADKVVRALAAARIDAVAIHGNKTQGQRTRALAGFRDGAMPVLVATDIAARGIDVDDIGLVVNYDLPHVPETYVHRIGRTARAGASGAAVSFCGSEERPLLRAIEKLIRGAIPERGGVAGRTAPPPPPAGTPAGSRRNDRPSAAKARRRGGEAPAPRQDKPRIGTYISNGAGTELSQLPFMRGMPAKDGGEGAAAMPAKPRRRWRSGAQRRGAMAH